MLECRHLMTRLRCVLYGWGWDFHMSGKVQNFGTFLPPTSTRNVSEGPNSTSTFVFVLIFIFIFLCVDIGWRGCGVFCMCEDEIFTCLIKCSLSAAFCLLNPHVTSVKVLTWQLSTFVVMLTFICLSVDIWWHGWGVFCMHGWGWDFHISGKVQILAAFCLPLPHETSVKVQTLQVPLFSC